MGFSNEWLGKCIQTRLKAELASGLDDVEATWLALGDPVTLTTPPDDDSWFHGHNPDILDLDSVEFPYVAVMVPERKPTGISAQWGYQEQAITAFVDYYVVAEDEATVNKVAYRYGEAIVNILQEEQDIDAFSQTNYEPEVRMSEAMRHLKVFDNSDNYESDDVDYIQAGRVVLEFDHG